MSGPSSPNPAAVRAALARILAVPRFAPNESLVRLLRFVVEETLNGHGPELKETVLGIEVFGRGGDFDPKTDSIVRTQARKLRARLAEYYAAEGAGETLRIHLPKGGYVPILSGSDSAELRAADQPARRRWPWMLAAVAACALLAIAGSWWRARSASAEIRSVAVLPFADRSPQKDEDWFCDGLTEEIIDAMTRVPGLHVVARTSAFEFKGKPRDIRKIGEQLGVAAVLEGSVRKDGGKLRITAQLNRAADGYHLWSLTFDRPAGDVFFVPKEIAEALAERIRIPHPAAPKTFHRPSQQAYNAYLEGRYYFNRIEPDSLNKAVDRFDEATGIDPEFALAWSWLSIAREYRVDEDLVRPNEAMPGARDAAERAVALDPDAGETHAALAIVKLQYDWDWAGAKEEFDRAIQLSPGSGFLLHWRGHWFETQGRLKEASAEMQRALALDPLSGLILGDVVVETLAGPHPEQALAFARKAVNLYPDAPWAKLSLLDALYAAGQKAAARQMARDLENSPAAIPEFALRSAGLAARDGDTADARKLLAQADDLRDSKYVPADVFAGLAAAAKDWDTLFHWLAVEQAERSTHLPYVRLNPGIPASDPRFLDLLRRMNLPAAPPSPHAGPLRRLKTAASVP